MLDFAFGIAKSVVLVFWVLSFLPFYIIAELLKNIYQAVILYLYNMTNLLFGFTSFDSKNQILKWDWLNIDMEKDTVLPSDFVWGVATCSYQVEGGEPDNNWFEWERKKFPNGKPHIRGGQICGKATDHWNRVDEDVQLIKDLKANSYRFGLSWEKIEPQQGVFDAEVIKHYHREIDLLISNGIEPMITLHHFTEPLWFTKLGHFEKEENLKLMLPFVERVYREFGDKVCKWCTINEPEVFAFQGWGSGLFPPGKKDNYFMVGTVIKHMLMTHVSCYKLIKSIGIEKGWVSEVGIVKDLWIMDPKQWWNPLDNLTAQVMSETFNGSIMTFLRTGVFSFYFPFVANINYVDKSAVMCNDFIGLNFYSHYYISLLRIISKGQDPKANPEDQFDAGCTEELPSDMPNSIYAEGFYRAIMECAKLNINIYITENGLADKYDDRRELFIKRYVYAMSRAMQDGAKVKGYYYWSLMDNFEWGLGYDMRFGLVHVDYNTCQRTIKNSGRYFASQKDKFNLKDREMNEEKVYAPIGSSKKSNKKTSTTTTTNNNNGETNSKNSKSKKKK